jgi:hypothetical protein
VQNLAPSRPFLVIATKIGEADSADDQKRDFEPVDRAERSVEIATPSQKGQKIPPMGGFH